MNNYTKGWLLFVAAMGAFSTMVAVDVSQMPAWESATSPTFVGKCLGYFGTVIGAFVAGKLIPSEKS